jgi:hypothetical protein
MSLLGDIIREGLMRDTEVPGDGVQALALATPAADFLDGLLIDLGSAVALATGTRFGDAGADPLGDERALELGDGRNDGEHGLAHWRGGVDLLGDGNKVHPEVAEFFQRINELFRRAREAVELPHQNRVELAGANRLPQPLQGRSIGGGAAHLIDELGRDRQPAVGGIGAQLAQLHGGVLVQGRDPGVDGGAELWRCHRLSTKLTFF